LHKALLKIFTTRLHTASPYFYIIISTTMLIGEYEGKLTDKNRLAIPKKFRDEFSEGLVLSRGYEGCLILLDKPRWDELGRVIESRPVLSLSIRDTKRFILGSAYELDLDSQGRFVLPNNLKTHAEIGDDVVFVGISDWVEVWSRDRWEQKLKNLITTAPDIAEQLLQETINVKQ
jgi:MraZ protein